MSQYPICPLCKYNPKRNKDGKVHKGNAEFCCITVSHDFREDYTSSIKNLAFKAIYTKFNKGEKNKCLNIGYHVNKLLVM